MSSLSKVSSASAYAAFEAARSAFEAPDSIDLTAGHSEQITLKSDDGLPEAWVSEGDIESLKSHLRSKGFKGASWRTPGGTVYCLPVSWTIEQINTRWDDRADKPNTKGMTSMRILLS